MVNRWRIILAVAVIFIAGAASGALASRALAPRREPKQQIAPPLPVSSERRLDYLTRLDREVQLTPEQRQKVEAILAESQKRMKELWQQIEPQTRQEYQRTRKDISELLTPEQREKMKRMRHGKDRDKEKDREKKEPRENKEQKPGACVPRNLRVAPVLTPA